MEKRIKIKYDREADAIYIYLRDLPYAYGVDLDNHRRVDYALDKKPIGIELLSVSKGIILEGLPEQEEVGSLLEKRFKVFA